MRRRSPEHRYRYRKKSSSDSELAQAGGRWPAAEEEEEWSGRRRCFLHEGLDVDQLARYRRRRVEGRPRDHLGLVASEEEEEDDDEEEEAREGRRRAGRRRRFVTEYRRAFHASCDDIFRDGWQASLPPIRIKHQADDSLAKSNNVEEISAINSGASYHVPLNSIKVDPERAKDGDPCAHKSQNEPEFGKTMDLGTSLGEKPALIRRGTSLMRHRPPGGDLMHFSSATEYSSYVPHSGHHRAELQRRKTSLRMEGEFEARTEKGDKFVEWPGAGRHRPEPYLLPGQLRLEGELETSTESQDNYVPFVGARRPDILRRPAQLRLEGEASWTPEYADVFREHGRIEHRISKKPESNLRPGGNFYEKTETTDFFKNPIDKETELMEELIKDAEEEEKEKRKKEEEISKRKKEEEMRLLVSKLEDLKNPPLEVPEYKDAYKDFPRERPRLLKPEDEIGRADGTKVALVAAGTAASPTPSRFRTKIDRDPEYKSIYLDAEARSRPICRRPPIPARRPSAGSSSRNGGLARGHTLDNGGCCALGYQPRENRVAPDELLPLSEIRSQYVDYGQVPRAESLRTATNLRLEGKQDLEPEYRDAYCSNRDLHRPPEHHQQRRLRERSPSASRRIRDGGNYWLDNDNGDRFGAINAADEQDAFQVLQTRVHEESVVGKPPPGSRRNSRSSLARGSLDGARPSDRSPHRQLLRNRSPSPSYRLQVSHADEEPRGFARPRRSPILQNLGVHASSNRSPSPVQQPPERSYSPSFARESSATRHPRQQSFVVLDSEETDDDPPRRRLLERPGHDGRADRPVASSRAGIGHPGFGPRDRTTPTNWMPPWYDSSTSTI